MSTINRGPLGSAFLINRDPANNPNASGSSNGNASTSGNGAATAFAPEPVAAAKPAASATAIPMPGPTFAPDTTESTKTSPASSTYAAPGMVPVAPPRGSLVTTDLVRSLAEVKGQAQFLLYLADQIEDSLHQLIDEHDDCQNSFLCRILSMYSTQLETKHHGLGDKIAETCQEVYVTVREYDHS